MKRNTLYAALDALYALLKKNSMVRGPEYDRVIKGFAPIPGAPYGLYVADLPRAKPLPVWARGRLTEAYTTDNRHAGGKTYVASVPPCRAAITGTSDRRRRRAERWARRRVGTPPAHIAPWVVNG